MASFSNCQRLFLAFSDIFNKNDILLGFLCHQTEEAAALTSLIRRDHVPKLNTYMGAVFPDFAIPEHVDDFSTHFRVSRNLFDVILQEVYQPSSLTGTGPNASVSPEKQLLVCLWYIANMSSMREVAHIFGLSKSTVHAIVFRVVHALQGLAPRVIAWPSPNRQREIALEVEQTCRLPGVIGFLDGTHIRLSSALQGDRDYYNRKGFPSMQLQAVVDNEMRFTNIFTGWPGCVHDARVLRNSALHTSAEAGEIVLQDHQIFADNAYPLRNWLLVPFRNFGNLTPQQVRFNKRLSMVRQTVERAFGHMKGRFRRIRELPFHSAEEICNVIYAVCILYNLCVDNADDVDNYIQEPEDDPNQNVNIYQNGHNGMVRRLRLVNIP